MNPINKQQESQEISEGLAEFYGAMIGDGCLSRYYSNYAKKEIFCLLITGHVHDESYFRKTLQKILLKNFGRNGCIRSKSNANAMRFETTSKTVFDFFKTLGFPVGKKGDRLTIPESILKDNLLSLSCVRGIFDTDGSIYNRYSKQYSNHAKKYNYKNIEFKMNCKRIIEQVKLILEKNDIITNNIRKNGTSYVLRITNQNSIKRFYTIIKPSNPYHIERFLN